MESYHRGRVIRSSPGANYHLYMFTPCDRIHNWTSDGEQAGMEMVCSEIVPKLLTFSYAGSLGAVVSAAIH